MRKISFGEKESRTKGSYQPLLLLGRRKGLSGCLTLPGTRTELPAFCFCSAGWLLVISGQCWLKVLLLLSQEVQAVLSFQYIEVTCCWCEEMRLCWLRQTGLHSCWRELDKMYSFQLDHRTFD